MVLVPPFEQLIDTLTDASDMVAILHVEGKEARRTSGSRRERDVPGQEWIRSVVTARVERLLKPSPKLPLGEGSRVTFIEEGGTLRVGRTLVEAVVPWARPFQVGTRYLVFSLVPSPEERYRYEPEQITAGANSSYEDLGPGAARRLRNSDPSEFDQIESMGIAAAAVLIEQRVDTYGAR